MSYLGSHFRNFFFLLYLCSFSTILHHSAYFHGDNSGTDLVFSFAIPSANYHSSSYLSIEPTDEENLITKTQGFYRKWYWKFQDSAYESELIHKCWHLDNSNNIICLERITGGKISLKLFYVMEHFSAKISVFQKIFSLILAIFRRNLFLEKFQKNFRKISVQFQ